MEVYIYILFAFEIHDNNKKRKNVSKHVYTHLIDAEIVRKKSCFSLFFYFVQEKTTVACRDYNRNDNTNSRARQRQRLFCFSPSPSLSLSLPLLLLFFSSTMISYYDTCLLQAWRPWPSSFFFFFFLVIIAFASCVSACCLRVNTKVVTNVRKKKVTQRHSLVIRCFFFSNSLSLLFFSSK